jgi:hypothetical protein
MTFNQGVGNQFFWSLYKNSQFKYCQRPPLLRFVSNCFLFRRMVWKGIPRVCFYFCSTQRNSDLFSLLQKGSEGNSKSLLLFLFLGFRVVFSSTEGFGTEFREFSVPRNSRNSVGNNHLFHLFRLPLNYFFVGIPYPSKYQYDISYTSL